MIIYPIHWNSHSLNSMNIQPVVGDNQLLEFYQNCLTSWKQNDSSIITFKNQWIITQWREHTILRIKIPWMGISLKTYTTMKNTKGLIELYLASYEIFKGPKNASTLAFPCPKRLSWWMRQMREWTKLEWEKSVVQCFARSTRGWRMVAGSFLN